MAKSSEENRLYYIRHRAKKLQKSTKRYYKLHPNATPRIKLTPEEREDRNRQTSRDYYQRNRKEIRAYQKEYSKVTPRKWIRRKPKITSVIDKINQIETHQRLILACDIADGKRPVNRAKIMKCPPGCMPQLFAKTGRVDI